MIVTGAFMGPVEGESPAGTEYLFSSDDAESGRHMRMKANKKHCFSFITLPRSPSREKSGMNERWISSGNSVPLEQMTLNNAMQHLQSPDRREQMLATIQPREKRGSI